MISDVHYNTKRDDHKKQDLIQKNEFKQKVNNRTNAKTDDNELKIKSALSTKSIAPSDFEHIFKQTDQQKPRTPTKKGHVKLAILEQSCKPKSEKTKTISKPKSPQPPIKPRVVRVIHGVPESLVKTLWAFLNKNNIGIKYRKHTSEKISKMLQEK